jgi:hypothetical protein
VTPPDVEMAYGARVLTNDSNGYLVLVNGLEHLTCQNHTVWQWVSGADPNNSATFLKLPPESILRSAVCCENYSPSVALLAYESHFCEIRPRLFLDISGSGLN